MSTAHRWLAVLRIFLGLLFLESGTHKLSWGDLQAGLPIPTVSQGWREALPKRLLEFAEKNPIGWYRAFLYHAAIPNSRLFAALVAWGELLLGLSLVLGLFARTGAFAGFFLAGNYFLANSWMGPCQRNLDLLLLVVLLALGCVQAGQCWGLDGKFFPSRGK
ncbi:thiosulfate dehydrogenase [quinone] large subunit [Methylacidimicrobium cyclopophantes]|uniref:Thiosulfate dehydrogenase [quinone] large subunit n=1 Tax=Methylacidimicrobium cyclopophantes TaxID=1041766 RepID=A0A5E6M613_9BACT|nr:DoxX family membrane protein [Methylacidimicrobium cyclopophantes]VVM04355.1 thiosulfate dehydrogenase [quinone] large subunit [Methylacidimicrobium cyclopophantes]